jgi:hypothetical protein
MRISLLVERDGHRVDPIVFAMSAQPDDEKNLVLIIDRGNQSEIVAFDVEYHALGRNDTC